MLRVQKYILPGGVAQKPFAGVLRALLRHVTVHSQEMALPQPAYVYMSLAQPEGGYLRLRGQGKPLSTLGHR